MQSLCARSNCRAYLVGILTVAALSGPTAEPLASQPVEDFEPPIIEITPSGGTFTNPSVAVTIEWCDNYGLNGNSRVIKHNGATVTGSFSYSPSGSCAYSQKTVTLTAGTNSIYGYICDTSSWCDSETVYLTYDPKKAPAVTVLSNQAHRDPALCGEGCSDFVMTYSTPAYRSLDQDRSTTLVYRSDQAKPMPMVLLNVQDPSGDPADTISVRLKQKWTGSWQTLHTGGTEVYYDNPNTLNHSSLVAVGVNASLTTGSYDYTAYVYSRWSDGSSRETQIDVRVLILNEQSSPYGAGWSVAGVHRIHTQVLGGSEGIVVTDGGGGIAFLPESCFTDGGNTTCLYTEPAGWPGELEYDSWLGTEPYRWLLPDGGEVRFDTSGRMTSVRDRYGNVTTYAYDGSNRLTSITDPAGKATTFGYGVDSKLDWIKDPGNRQSTITINGSYDVTQIQDPAAGYTLQGMVYSSHRMTVHKDRATSQWDVAYDFAGRVDSIMAPTVKIHTGASVRPATQITSVQASLMDASSSLASPGANRTASNRRVVVRDPEGHETIFRSLNGFGQPEEIEFERGRIARVLHNGDGRVTREVSPTNDSISYTWTSDRLTQTTYHATGQAVLYEYTTYDNVSRIHGSGLPDVRHYYYSNGSPKHTTVNGDTLVSYAASDTKGRPTTVTDAEGHQTSYGYGTGFQNVQSLTAGGQTTNWRYDSYGRLQHVINALGDTATASYDAINRVTSTRDEAGGVTTYGYGSMYLTSVTDPLSQVYAFHQNPLGWDTTVVDPGGRKENYKYDRDGAVRSYVNRRGQTVSGVYNEAHELTSTTAGGQTTTFSISADLLTQTASNAHSTDTIKYNKRGQTLEETAWRGGVRFQVERTYDTQMRLWAVKTRRSGSIQNNVIYSYDGAGLLSQVSTTSAGSTTIGYDPRFNARTFRWSLSGDTLQLSHPSLGSPGRYRYSDASTEAFAGLRYEHDALKRISDRWSGDLTEWNEYLRDALGQLEQVDVYNDPNPGQVECEWIADKGEVCEPSASASLVATESFDWDAVGNPSGETVDAGNRLRTLGAISLTYDLDGNITKRTGGGETVDYWWNSLSQLDSANHSTLGKIRYKYDGFGRRVSTNDAVGTTQFLWDQQNVVADIDGSGNLIRHYNYYPGGLTNLHSMRAGSSPYLYVKDVTGNVLGLLNSAGNVVSEYSYSAFGDLVDVNETVANRFRFASGEQDRLGIYYFRARYYEPKFMRFLSEDPIGLGGGINQFVYAGNNPIDLTDRSGLCPENEEELNKEAKVPCLLPGITVTVPPVRPYVPPALMADGSGLSGGNYGGSSGTVPALTVGGAGHEGSQDSAFLGITVSCWAGIAAAAYATAEDLSTVVGAGLVLKGVRGARLGVQAARVGGWLAADRLALPHAGALVNNRALSRTMLANVGLITWDASTSSFMGNTYSLLGSAASILPGWNMYTALTGAIAAC